MEIIQQILAIGGFGYLNYFMFSRLSDFNMGNESDTKFQILFFSSLDYVIYLLVSYFFDNPLLRGVLTIVVAILITILLPSAYTLLFSLINKLRGLESNVELVPKHVLDSMFEDTSHNFWFMFDLETDRLIEKGYPAKRSGTSDWFSITLHRFRDDVDPAMLSISDRKDLDCFINSHELEVKTYINFDKGFKVVYF